jgi:phospholipase/carboxylesterase
MLQSSESGVGVLAVGGSSPDSVGVSAGKSVSQKLRLELDFGKFMNEIDVKEADGLISGDVSDIYPKSVSRYSAESVASSSPQHILVSPIYYEAGYSYPLFVWLHDQGCDERQILRLMPQISLRNYVAVAPQGRCVVLANSQAESDANSSAAAAGGMGKWNCFEAIALLQTARTKPTYSWFFDEDGTIEAERQVFDSIAAANNSCNIAQNRIFIGGSGVGGTMALRLAMLYPQYFAGVAALDALMPDNDNVLCHWDLARRLPVFLGLEQSGKIQKDCTKKMVALLYSAGFKLTIREYQNDDKKPKLQAAKNIPTKILQDVNRWMMSIVCGDNCNNSDNNTNQNTESADYDLC